MADNTKIEWATHTWSPWTGCTKLAHARGSACDHCYAAAWAKRAGRPELWEGERRRTSADYWQKPIKWNRLASVRGARPRIFPSLCDPFDNQVPTRWRDDMWHRIDQTPHLDWLLLTKRPQNIAKMLPDPKTGIKSWGAGWPNVWLGTTAEDQERYDQRWPHLARIPARIRFISYEPALGPLTDLWAGSVRPDWLIAGGESGGAARPAHPDWFRHIRDYCATVGTAFLFKQWGEWVPQVGAVDGWTIADNPEISRFDHRDWEGDHWSEPYRPMWCDDRDDDTVSRVGKKAAGRLLDGREWSEFPA
jgi:protein gp37